MVLCTNHFSHFWNGFPNIGFFVWVEGKGDLMSVFFFSWAEERGRTGPCVTLFRSDQAAHSTLPWSWEGKVILWEETHLLSEHHQHLIGDGLPCNIILRLHLARSCYLYCIMFCCHSLSFCTFCWVTAGLAMYSRDFWFCRFNRVRWCFNIDVCQSLWV